MPQTELNFQQTELNIHVCISVLGSRNQNQSTVNFSGVLATVTPRCQLRFFFTHVCCVKSLASLVIFSWKFETKRDASANQLEKLEAA